MHCCALALSIFAHALLHALELLDCVAVNEIGMMLVAMSTAALFAPQLQTLRNCAHLVTRLQDWRKRNVHGVSGMKGHCEHMNYLTGIVIKTHLHKPREQNTPADLDRTVAALLNSVDHMAGKHEKCNAYGASPIASNASTCVRWDLYWCSVFLTSSLLPMVHYMYHGQLQLTRACM